MRSNKKQENLTSCKCLPQADGRYCFCETGAINCDIIDVVEGVSKAPADWEPRVPSDRSVDPSMSWSGAQASVVEAFLPRWGRVLRDAVACCRVRAAYGLKMKQWAQQVMESSNKLGSRVAGMDCCRLLINGSQWSTRSSMILGVADTVSDLVGKVLCIVYSPLLRFWIARKQVPLSARDDVLQESLKSIFLGNWRVSASQV